MRIVTRLRYASEYRLIVVMPEGNDGWYTNSTTKPNDRYESYILMELMPDVQRRYRTIEARYGRAIAGLSMGGYGAIKFGLKSPHAFVFAASMSGGRELPGDHSWGYWDSQIQEILRIAARRMPRMKPATRRGV